jgi:hypothetical protein
MNLLRPQNLVILVPLAREQHEVAAAREPKRDPDRRAAVGLDEIKMGFEFRVVSLELGRLGFFRSVFFVPASTSSRIFSGSSVRGLSEVRTATSASRAAASPMSGRLPRSRSPPQPNTATRRPGVSGFNN